MTNKEIKDCLQNFIDRIHKCASQKEAIKIREQIEEFYNTHDVPNEDDILLQSGLCEMLAMMAL